MGQPRPLFCFFIFSNKHYKFNNKYKCEKCPSSIWHWDSNSQPSDYESPPLTTRPKLPPKIRYLCLEYSIFALKVSSEL